MIKMITVASLLLTTNAISQPLTVDAPCQVYFSPKGGVTKAVTTLIDSSKVSVHVLAYSFTSQPVADALIRAKKRGVDVQAVLDKSQPTANGSKMQDLINAGIPTFVDKKHAIAHNKVLVVDGKFFENGSFNFTTAAENSNGENALICPSVSGAKDFEENFITHQSHSEKQ